MSTISTLAVSPFFSQYIDLYEIYLVFLLRWSCLVLFFFIVDHEMDSHAKNQKPSRKKCVIN